MPCTTLLVGKDASYDGSTIIARNEDSPDGEFTPKKLAVIHPDQQPRTYRSVLSHLELQLDEAPMRYTSVPNALGTEGVWAEAGVNERNVAMSATETLTTNERVLAADPLVELRPGKGVPGEDGYVPEVPGGIGEEDMVTIVLPYATSARDGVRRLGALLEQHGTYEMNGIAFSDVDEIWWMETVGGHHWIARRVPDDCYVTMPNQLGIDAFDLADAEGAQVECMASADLRAWMAEHHLDLTLRDEGEPADVFNPREAFGSASDADHVYNTPRAWAMQRLLNPRSNLWDGPDADLRPEDDDIPWCRTPERKITMEDVKRALSLHYQGTPFDPYGRAGSDATRGHYRPIGINRNGQLAAIARPRAPFSGWPSARTPSTCWCRSSPTWTRCPSTCATPRHRCPRRASIGQTGWLRPLPTHTSTSAAHTSSATSCTRGPLCRPWPTRPPARPAACAMTRRHPSLPRPTSASRRCCAPRPTRCLTRCCLRQALACATRSDGRTARQDHITAA